MSCANSVVVSASADTVWSALRNFHDMSWAPEVITSCEAVGDLGGSTPGAQRILNGAFHETLRSVDDDKRILTYSIDDGPPPVSKDDVSNYLGKIVVHEVTDTGEAFVLWTSDYETADVPAVQGFCNPIYQALLNALKEHYA